MKYEHNVIRDLMPLYHDGALSAESVEAVEEHVAECPECKKYYETMLASDRIEEKAYDETAEQEKAEAFARMKKRQKKRIGWIIFAAIAGTFVTFVIPILVTFAVLFFGWSSAKVEVNEDIERYEEYMTGEQGKAEYSGKWGMDESIWPEHITDDMTVTSYVMASYDPWDIQYVGLLVADFDQAGYEAEVARLREYPSTEYIGYYGAEGFSKYELLAMYADSYQGFVYALTDGEDTVIYVEMIFCNYFMDLDYTDYIPEEYLPDGFDAGEDNAYRKKMLKEN